MSDKKDDVKLNSISVVSYFNSEGVLSDEEFFGRSARCENSFHASGFDEWDRFWEEVESPQQRSCCCKLDIPTGGISGSVQKEAKSLEREVNIDSEVFRAVYMRINVEARVNLSLNFRLNSPANLIFCVISEIGSLGKFKLRVHSDQVEGSEFAFKGRFVMSGGAALSVDTLGSLNHEASRSQSSFSTKILQLGEGNVIDGAPQMDIKNKKVSANHGFSVGSVPVDKMKYLMSRGLDEKEARRFYAKGFLKEVI